MTPGFVPADLKALTGISGAIAIERFLKEFAQYDILPDLTDSGIIDHFIFLKFIKHSCKVRNVKIFGDKFQLHAINKLLSFQENIVDILFLNC